MLIFVSIFFILFIICVFSNLKIIISDCQKDNYNIKAKYKVKVGVYLFGLIKIFGVSLNEKGIVIFGKTLSYNKIKMKKVNVKELDLKLLKDSIKKFNFKIEKFNLNLNLGLENMKLTVFSIAVLSTILSILLSKFYNKNNLNYKINPIFNQNVLNYNFKATFSAKLFDVLILFKNIKKSINKENNESFESKLLKV